MAVQSLTKQSRRDFTTRVHNRIVAGCAAAQCHGNPGSTLRLWRPQGSRGLDSTSAQRNLHAILQYVDRRDPESSSLIDFLAGPHGGQETGTFDVDSAEWKIIRDWVLTTIKEESLADNREQGVIQTSWQTTDSAASGNPESGHPPQPVDLLTAARQSEPGDEDRFDPEYFNRNFAGAQPTTTSEAQPKPTGKSRSLPPVDEK